MKYDFHWHFEKRKNNLMKYLYWILCALIAIFMNYLGCNIFTWQWWVGCGFVWLSFLCGWVEGSKEK